MTWPRSQGACVGVRVRGADCELNIRQTPGPSCLPGQKCSGSTSGPRWEPDQLLYFLVPQSPHLQNGAVALCPGVGVGGKLAAACGRHSHPL